jgi:hypothetical protein
MAQITSKGSVSAQQRKPVLMVLDLLHRHLPSSYRVTLLAASAKLAFVDVGMAISTFHSHTAKDRLGVTRDASHVLV